MRTAAIAAGIASIIALGTAGYFANEWRVCSGLEEDFITKIEGYTLTLKNGALMGAMGVDTGISPEEQEQLQNLNLKSQTIMLNGIYSRCGPEAGQAAANRAQAILQDGMKDIISIPNLH